MGEGTWPTGAAGAAGGVALQQLCQRLLSNNIGLGEKVKGLSKRRKALELVSALRSLM